ncbi:MAG: hypothetical protein CMJ18_19260 [Phycisphaeraceae bacterium]|nr:hypothetical protein [Phycisphaeraceae bacterium]
MWLGDGSGNFADSGQNLASEISSGVTLGDLDGDGDLDAVVVNQSGADSRVWLNRNPPRVTQVLVGGTSWTAPFLDQLEAVGTGGARGYPIPVGSVAQLDSLPWAGTDQVIIRFSETVDVIQADLALSGTLGPDGIEDASDDYAFSGFTTETGPDGSFQAVWTLPTPLRGDRLRLRFGDGSVTGVGVPLDGEWSDATSVFPSGNGVPGGAFSFRIDTAPADVDRDGAATIFDIRPLREALGAVAGAGAYSIFADLNGDGTVDDLDKAPLRENLGSALPTSAPQPARNGFSVTLGGADRVVTTPSAAISGSVDITFGTDEGIPLNLLNYSVRVRVEGPGDGADVVLVGGGAALNAPAATAPDPLNAFGNTDHAPREYYHGTVNFTETPFPVSNGDGLIRVDYRVLQGALGVYTFDIVSGRTHDTALIEDVLNTAVPFAVAAPRLIVTIPGDLNGDFTVGTSDLATVLTNFTQNVPTGDLSRGDASGPGGVPDGIVGTDDLLVVLANFTNSITPPTSRAAAQTDTVDALALALARWQGWGEASLRAATRGRPGWLDRLDEDRLDGGTGGADRLFTVV